MKGILIKGALAVFGVFMGLLMFEGVLHLLPTSGSEFESIEDLQGAMLSGGDTTPQTNGSVNLREIVSPEKNDKLIYDLRPNLDVTFQKVPVITNSLGLRGKEISINPPKNTFRIALLGDSFAFGWGVTQNKIFAQRLEDNLNRISQGNPTFEVINLGVPGYSTFQEVEKLKIKGLCLKPDAVLVYFVQNDFGMPFFVRSLEHDHSLFTATQFSKLLFKQDPKAVEAQMKQKGWDPNTAIKDLIDIGNKEGIKLFFTINPRDSWKEDLKKLWSLKDSSITFIRMREDLLRIVDDRKIPIDKLQLPDDPHPSEIRHAILGDLITPYFLEFIRHSTLHPSLSTTSSR